MTYKAEPFLWVFSVLYNPEINRGIIFENIKMI